MLTYYTIDVSLFTVVLTYGLLSGLGISLTYVTPLACGMQWYPQQKGLINGLIVAGFGLGALFSTNFQTLYLNPHNKPPESDGYFTDPDILGKVQSVFILLGLVFLVMQYVGCLLISKPSAAEMMEGECLLSVTEEPDESNVVHSSTTQLIGRDVRPAEVIKNKNFYIFWSIYLLNTIAVGYINAMYKSFGQTFISDDHFLAEIGSFAAVFNAVGRIAWGRLMDKTSFRVTMRILTVVLMLLFATMPLTKHMGKAGFAGWVWLIFFTFSGTFVLMPTVVEKAFGASHYSANYGLLFTSQTVSGPLMAAVNQLMLNAVGYTGCFLTISGILSLSVVMTFLVPNNL
nr:oxalate:formate antiporter-like [Cherax quadricarinatus]